MVADQLIELSTEMVNALRGNNRCDASVLDIEPLYPDTLEEAVKKFRDAQRQ